MEGLAKIAILHEELTNIRAKKTRIEDAEARLQNKLDKVAREIGSENMNKAGIKQKPENHEALLNERMLSKLDKARKSEKGREEFLKFLANEPGAIESYVRFIAQ